MVPHPQPATTDFRGVHSSGVNAGHLPPMLVRRNGGDELEIQRLTEGGPVLGLLKGAEYRQGHAMVRPGDLLLLYSDGVVDVNGGEKVGHFGGEVVPGCRRSG
jgi:serine phosphatase RsbU (regulator of sigma subunit)